MILRKDHVSCDSLITRFQRYEKKLCFTGPVLLDEFVEWLDPAHGEQKSVK